MAKVVGPFVLCPDNSQIGGKLPFENPICNRGLQFLLQPGGGERYKGGAWSRWRKCPMIPIGLYPREGCQKPIFFQGHRMARSKKTRIEIKRGTGRKQTSGIRKSTRFEARQERKSILLTITSKL